MGRLNLNFYFESPSPTRDNFNCYNLTNFADSFEHYLHTAKAATDNFTIASVPSITADPFTMKQQIIRIKAQNRAFRAILAELEALFKLFEDFQISRDDLLLKSKNFTVQSMDVINRVFASSIVLFTGGMNLVLSVVVSIISSAVEFFYFLSQSMVFFWLLYYLITSESGGVMEHVSDMLPVSETTRSGCAKVLDHSVSSVLLATAKMAFFQAAVTWLLFQILLDTFCVDVYFACFYQCSVSHIFALDFFVTGPFADGS